MREIAIIGEDEAKEILASVPLEDRLRGYYICNEYMVILRVQRFLNNPKTLVDLIVNLKRQHNQKIYLPFLANPYNIATLHLIGVDVFDFSSAKYHAKLGKKYTVGGITEAKDKKENIYEENLNFLRKTVEDLKEFKRKGLLREFAERTSDSWARVLLRYADIFHHNFYEIFYPVRAPQSGFKIYADYIESLYRPDVVRFRKRIAERYLKPRCAKYLILLPCSAKKPYEKSKTHRRINKYLSSLKNAGIFHRVVVTSPLGLVPMELQYTYPAAHYDLPVIGYWFREEIDIIVEMLERFTRGYAGTFAYGEDLEFLKNYFDLEHFTDIRDMVSHLKEIEKEEDFVDKKTKKLCDFESISSFQFGKIIWEGTAEVKGKSLFVEGENYLNFSTETGMLILTEKSAEYLAKERIYTVTMEDFDLTGDLFAAGVLDASDDIRIGDEVAIVDSSENLRAWGTAKMNYLDMRRSNRGLAVAVRHRVKRNSKHN